MLAQVRTKLVDLEAFCQDCPPGQEVTALLESLGFHLTFKMDALPYSKKTGQPISSLPAQYHYRDQHNTEIIFLAGKDCAETGKYPPHASHWWIYPGSSQYSYNLVVQTLSRRWKMATCGIMFSPAIVLLARKAERLGNAQQQSK